jgi:hypothetical protein
MNMRRKVFILITILILCSLCAGRASQHAQTLKGTSDSSAPPDGWVLYPTPSAESEALNCGNYSMREWNVTLKDGSLKIRLDRDSVHWDPLPPEINSASVKAGSKTDRHVIRVDDGWLIGLNSGEFGGGLWWFSSDGKTNRRLIDDRVVGFVNTPNGVFALVGLAHKGSDFGRVLRITDGKVGDRQIETVADLGSAPQTFVVESPESLLVLTRRGLVRLKTSGKIESLFKPNYRLLYPNSMALSSSGVIYIGIRLFVTRLTPDGDHYKEEWLVPKNCTRFQVRNLDCVCKSGRK